jgi:hypothetical protein
MSCRAVKAVKLTLSIPALGVQSQSPGLDLSAFSISCTACKCCTIDFGEEHSEIGDGCLCCHDDLKSPLTDADAAADGWGMRQGTSRFRVKTSVREQETSRIATPM